MSHLYQVETEVIENAVTFRGKYPKTDYTYSPLSRDRVELAPGQVAVPNMSRRSLAQYRVAGDLTSRAELDQLMRHEAWKTAGYESSGDECVKRTNNGLQSRSAPAQRWWLTQLLLTVVTVVTTTVTDTWQAVTGRRAADRYTRLRSEPGIVKQAASVVLWPLVWVYRSLKTIVTTTTTTITNTISGGDTEPDGAYYRRQYRGAQAAARDRPARRIWPWLLLLPLLGYACYHNRDVLIPISSKTSNPVEDYVAPKIIQDPDLARRLSVLEDWIGTVDARLRYFDQKLSKVDSFEAQMESYSLKHLQQSLVQIFNINGKEGKTGEEMKEWLDKHYASRSDLADVSERVEGLKGDEKAGVPDEQMMRRLIEEYWSREEAVRAGRVEAAARAACADCGGGGGGGSGLDEAGVRRVVRDMLDVFDADKTGLVDYALESAGGQVLSTRCTELYQIKTKQYYMLGVPVMWVYTSPRHALTPGAMPAECWAFQGFPGYLVVRTFAIIEVTGFSIEHMSRLLAPDGKIESAPNNFSVYGLREEHDTDPHLFGSYAYDAAGPAIQHFPVQHQSTVDIGGTLYPVAYDIVELRVESNHGNPTYTCVYRFRVHGNPLSDVRRATEDIMHEAD